MSTMTTTPAVYVGTYHKYNCGSIFVSVAFIPSFIFASVSYHGHFREHGHYRGQKHALQQKTLDFHCAEPSL